MSAGRKVVRIPLLLLHSIVGKNASINDAGVSKTVSEMMSVTPYCNRSSDSLAKVAACYKKHPGIAQGNETGESALFKKGNIDITIHNPWMATKSGKMTKETFISIVKN